MNGRFGLHRRVARRLPGCPVPAHSVNRRGESDMLLIGSRYRRTMLCALLAVVAALQVAIAGGRHLDRAATGHTAAAAVFNHLRDARWVTDGHSPRAMYVFFDPNCPYCHYLYDVSQPFVRTGQVEMHWIPLGLLVSSSEGKAAAILEAKDRPAALAKNENGYRHPGGGGIVPIRPSGTTEAALARNMFLFRQIGPDVVPLIMWRYRNGRIGVHVGSVDKAAFGRLIREIRPDRSVLEAKPGA